MPATSDAWAAPAVSARAHGLRARLVLFVQLQIAMSLGALVCLLIGTPLRGSALAGVYFPGSVLYFIGDIVFLTVPAAAWVARRNGARDGAALAAAMVAPVLAAVAVVQSITPDPLRWMVNGMYPIMSLGAIAFVLARDRVRAA